MPDTSLQRVRVPIGKWKPDLDDFQDPGGLVSAHNFAPVVTGYYAIPTTEALSAALGAAVRGGHVHGTGLKSFNIYVGLPTTIKEVLGASPYTITDVGSGGGGAYTGSEPWFFTSWGNEVWATNYTNDVQRQTATTVDFAAGITSSLVPKARYIAAVKNQLWLANTNEGGTAFPHRVRWSGVDDALDFDADATTQSDFQDLLDDYGHITALVGGEYATIFKQRAIYRATYVGTPLIYQFDLVARGSGTVYPHSVVVVGEDIYFLAANGFRVLRANNTIEEIGDGALTRWFLGAENSLGSGSGFVPGSLAVPICGAHDQVNTLIMWAYAPSGATDLEFALFYNYQTNAWTFHHPDSNVSFLYDYNFSFLFTLPESGDVFRPVRNLWFVRHDSVSGDRLVARFNVAGINYSTTTSSTTTNYPHLKTAAAPVISGRSVTIKRIRPWYRNASGDASVACTIAVTTYNGPRGTETTTSYSTLDSQGWHVVNETGENFRFMFIFSGGSGDTGPVVLHEYEIEFADAGVR